MTAGWGAYDCKNPKVPLKGTRADLIINQESSIDARTTGTAAATQPADVMMIDSKSQPFSGEAQIVNGAPVPAPAAAPAALVHRGVTVAHLVPLIPESMRDCPSSSCVRSSTLF
ncbi:hypothetical protein [Glutamicibacter sp. AOP5-A2-18]|uniref:hypothetical protein n=1 Tax=Glutamicibacter sp. AOP5-A2-18 TaxID=3457656 RepID=UPI00403397E3